MPKKLIRLTEGDLHQIVTESVKRVLNEKHFWAGLRRSWNSNINPLEYLLNVHHGHTPTREIMRNGIEHDRKEGLSGYNTEKDRMITAQRDREAMIRNFYKWLSRWKEYVRQCKEGSKSYSEEESSRIFPHARILARQLGFTDEMKEMEREHNEISSRNRRNF